MARKLIRVVAAVIERDGKYLITQRKRSAVLPMLWEFPGGRVEHGETDERALEREVQERVGLEIVIRENMGEHTHAYDRYDVHLSTFACAIAESAVAQPVAVNDLRWVSSDELSDYKFPPADQKTMDKLLGLNNEA